MKKQSILGIFILLLALSACHRKMLIKAQHEKKPNILWIFSEDLSPFLGCYGDSINTGYTPMIDKLAQEGVLFTHAFATAPVCSPSRSAIITGKMQTTIGTHHHRSSRTTDGKVVPPELRINLPDYITTVPELMREAGYFTFNSGKDDYNFHYNRQKLYSVGTKDDYEAGMNGWQGNTSTNKISFIEDNWSSRQDKNQPWFGQIMILGGKGRSKHVRKGDKLATNDVPLPPYFPDFPSMRNSWTEHYNAVRGADSRVEEIINQLEVDGELENTIIFFFSDHGSNQSLRHKQYCYEGGLHIPLIIKGNHPSLKAGVVLSNLVSTLDISATTLDFGGVGIPDYFDGQSLFATDSEHRDYIISARDRCDYTIDRIRSVRSKNYRYIKNYFPSRPRLQANYRDKQKPVKEFRKRHKEGKLTPYQEQHWFGNRAEEELYDIDRDPHQMNNLAENEQYTEELEKHRRVLERWINETDDQGQYPESAIQLEATYDLWKDKPVFKNADVNPEYDQFILKSKK